MTSKREAIILAGGFGTRLAHVVGDVPKPMAPVAGRPFLRFLLDHLAESGFGRVVIADGYKRECIEDYFGPYYRGLDLVYSPEDTPLLTGGAVKRALALCHNEWVFVLNGDTYLDIDFDAVSDAVAKADAATTTFISAKEMRDFDRYGTLDISPDGTIAAFNEKRPCEQGRINAGVYALRRDALRECPEVFSLETDYFEKVVGSGCLRAAACEGPFIDIGVPEDYQRAQTMLAGLVRPWKIVLFDRDGTINVDTGHLFEPDKLQFIDEGVALLRKHAQDSDTKIVVVTNQAGIAKGYYAEDQMRHLHEVMGKRLAALGCRVDAWYYCPHHPEFTGPCSCRKPAPGMVLAALRDFDAVASECVMYGDKETDRQAAEAAGVPFFFVGE